MEELTFNLEVFSGPLDLLLNLISKNKVSIYDIPIATILDQYMEKLEEMKIMNLEVASEFIEMAAHLIYIKSRMLLPKEEEEEDPRMPLALALAEYQRYQTVVPSMHQLSEHASGSFTRPAESFEPDKKERRTYELGILIKAYHEVMEKMERRLPPPTSSFQNIVAKKITSVSVKILSVLKNLKRFTKVRFADLFKSAKTRSDIVATFLAVLELSKTDYVSIDQEQNDIVLTYDKSKKENA
ncbi:MAG: segregation/condensation protein A [Clostridia bacterium]|nr:segregation/condensation protein A [Clostridia bacterium]